MPARRRRKTGDAVMSATSAPGAIPARLREVEKRIRAACDRAGRDPAGVTLIGVTKTVAAGEVRQAFEAGLRDFGENYVQEGAAKKALLGRSCAGARWHLIGHLQTNKAGAAIEAFDVVQTVDSVRLAEALSRRAQRPLPVLLEVNAAAEASKFGFAASEVPQAVSAIAALPNLELRGLMTIAPAVPDAELIRPLFRLLRDLSRATGLQELSMGMSGDFEVAVEEGATMVRIGRAIFGERTA